jgi:hypothetical protein
MYTDLIFRWLHIFSAIALVGGIFFLRYVLAPTLAAQPVEVQRTMLSVWRPRWARMVMIASGLLLLSGLVNAVRIIIAWEFDSPVYHSLVAVKLVLGLVLFWLSAIVAGRTEMAEKFRSQMLLWLNISVLLAAVLVGLAGFMRYVPRTEKADTPAATGISAQDPIGR